jgi:dihydrofolate reductase
MGKLVESTFMALNGFVTAPHEWSPPYWDEEHAAYAAKLLTEADALLLGRKTYEGFAEAWPQRGGDPFTDRINSMPKYVASRTLRETTWNATLLGGDPAEEVAKLKADQNLLKYGTGELDRTLLAEGLVDELHVWVFPVLAARGDSLIEGLPTTHLRLVETTPFGSGIVVNTYTPAPR